MKLTENTKVKIRVPKHLYEAIQAELDMKRMKEDSYGEDTPMEEGDDYMEEDSINEAADHVGLMQQIIANPADTYEIVRMYLQQAPHEFSVLVAGLGTIATFLGGAAGVAIKDALNKIKSKKPTASEKPVAEELEETLDMETLLEAVNDAAKKKKMKVAKEKEVAAKKKAEDEKKKKEAEAKKKAAAAKKK